MSAESTWEQARERALALKPNDRRTLLLLGRLPLVSEMAMERISGVSHGASVYGCLARLREAGLVSSIRPAHAETPGPRLHYLTDLGLATVAVDQDVDVREFARRGHVRRGDILALLPRLDQLTAIYELLGHLAMAGPDDPHLVAYERPWRRRLVVPGRKAPLTLVMPAFATFDWGGQAGSFLLLPDVTGTPIRRYRQALDRMLLMRAFDKQELPLLVIAAFPEPRVARWKELLREVEQARREAPIPACVATWTDLPETLFHRITSGRVLPTVQAPQGKAIPRLKSARWTDPIPNLVGDLRDIEAGAVKGEANLGTLSLSLTRPDRAILQLLGRHPFLTPDEIGVVFGWTPKRIRVCCWRLIDHGLLRPLDEQEARGHPDAAGQLELTKEGLRLVAAQRRSGVSNATNQSTIIGGGPASSSRWRARLVEHLHHTIGANRVFVRLCDTARRHSSVGPAEALEEWQSPAESSRRGLYPDGYGMYRRGGKLHGFFLEYDRGSEKPSQYLKKFGAYYDFRDTGRFDQDYAGVPTILVVTTGNAAENRIARAAQAASVGRTCPLRILLTTEWRAKRDPEGYLGRVWRTPSGSFDQRCRWLAVPTDKSAVRLGPNAGRRDATIAS